MSVAPSANPYTFPAPDGHPGKVLAIAEGWYPFDITMPILIRATGELATYTEERLFDLCQQQLEEGHWWPDEKFLPLLYGVDSMDDLEYSL